MSELDSKPKPDRSAIDWERIEADYRAGLLSVREIAKAHGLTHGAINKRAKRDSWSRDLQARIAARAEELVSKRAVSAEVSKARLATDRQIIEANAERIAQVRSDHRVDIERVRTLGLTLLTELETQCADPQALADLGELMRKPDEKGLDRLNDLYRKIIDTPSRIDSAKKCVETIKTAITMEREAYGLDTTPDAPPSTVKRLEVHLVG